MLRCRWRWQTEVAVARQLSFGKQALRQASKRSPGKIPYQSPPKVERQHVKYPEKKAAIQGQHAGAPLTHHRPVEWIVYVVAMFLGGHVFLSYFYTFNFCYGVSMMPTIFSFGECVCLSKYYRRGRGIAVGDLVSFKHPIKHGEHALKRVIGLPGDLVLMNTPGKSDAMIEVPEGHFWAVGDNLTDSRDSRTAFGPLPMGLIVAKAIFKFNFQRYIPWEFESLQQGLRPADGSDFE